MLRHAAAFAIACILAAVAHAAPEETPKPATIKVGEKAPTFRGVDDAGKPWKSRDHVGKKIMVVYFYPADMTGGCTSQACAYRDALEDLKSKDVEVVGVSGDTVANHQVFKKEYDINFTLLADPEGKIAKTFGVKMVPGGAVSKNIKGEPIVKDGKPITLERGVTEMRWTFVIDKDGRVVHKDEKVEAAKDAEKVLNVVNKLREKEDKK